MARFWRAVGISAGGFEPPKPPLGTPLMKLTVAFRKFANVPKNVSVKCTSICVVSHKQAQQTDMSSCLNRLTPNDPYMGRTAPLTSKRCILYIYSTNIGTEYFKHALYSPFFSLQNAVCFIMLTCLVPVLITFYIQDVLKLTKIIPAPKG